MNIKNKEKNSIKVLGTRGASLLVELYERGLRTFGLSEIIEITGLTERSARKLIFRLIKRGVVSRLKPGLYNLVPFELGRQTEYFGNPYVIAKEIWRHAVKKNNGLEKDKEEYYISHGSAMDIHQMVTQPQLVIYTSTIKRIQNHTIMGMEFHFVTCKSSHIFGIKNNWVDKSEKVRVSDLERTILDGLKLPQYCGGITEVAKGLWMKRGDIDVSKMIDYAKQLNIGAVYRRLGFLLETYQIGNLEELNKLRQEVSKTYHVLDPTLPNEGKYNAKWGLRMNVGADELKAMIRT